MSRYDTNFLFVTFIPYSFFSWIDFFLLVADIFPSGSEVSVFCLQSRDEMCPYSDIEFAFALSTATEETLHYFRNLARIIELKVVNIGETPFPVFGGNGGSPCVDGFCMDSAGNTPLVRLNWRVYLVFVF
jgi:hypothetical protein